MTSTIAGQITNFNFEDVAAGVDDPVFGNDVQTIFEVAWSKQIDSPVSILAQNIAGDEHMRASFGAEPPTDLATNLMMPPGSLLCFQYIVDQLVVVPNGFWIILTAEGGRLSTDGEPEAHGPIELTSLTIVSSSDSWTTTLSGIIHPPADLPTVAFSVSVEETISVLGTIPASFSLQYSANPPVTKFDSSNLRSAITALEVLLGGAIGALFVGPLVFPLLAYGASGIDAYIESKLKPLALPLTPLQHVVDGIPQRLYLPGTLDNLWFHYDTISFPQGLVAQSVGYEGVISQQTGAAIVFSGRQSPVRARIIGTVLIVGPASVVLLNVIGSPQESKPLPVARQYSAYCNDQAVNPTFKWSLTTSNGKPVPSVKLSASEGLVVSLFFDDNGLTTPSGTLKLTVQMDDDLHLKDQNGNAPSNSLIITVTHQTETLPKTGSGILIPKGRPLP